MMRLLSTRLGLGSLSLGISLLAGAGIFHMQSASTGQQLAWQSQEVHLQNDLLTQANTALSKRVAKLEYELIVSEERRFAQEQEFLLWQNVISGMDPQGVLRAAGVLDAIEPEPLQDVVALAPDPLAIEASKLGISLNNLMASEGIHSLDLLESGRMQAGRMGPVVFRMLDDRGRLVGSLSATSVHFEASVTARTVTMILVEGKETHGGFATPFAMRRLPFSFVDPWPWVEALPGLFPDFQAGQATPSGIDDGTWEIEPLRERLNELLRQDSINGYYKVKHIDGVLKDKLRGLHLVEYSPAGLSMRHIFADIGTITLGDRGAAILLEDGASMRGNEKTVFLRGRFRIYLPKAQHDQWKAEPLPGLSAPAAK
ncbi:MAG: hypothetical protein ACI9D0_000084 [Bacteroidia bacterium]|jgi:hypothetical protein